MIRGEGDDNYGREEVGEGSTTLQCGGGGVCDGWMSVVCRL